MITGLHHISLKCGTPEEFEKTKVFYMELMGTICSTSCKHYRRN